MLLYSILSRKPRFACLFDAGAAILFFGALTQQPELQHAAANAVAELASQGYRIPTENDPVRIFPALTEGDFSGRHAGGWRPGAIYLRRQPQGGFGEEVYLRHELFHEASHRSCGGRLPQWLEEAAAMHFSGELQDQTPASWPSEAELRSIKARIQQGAELDANHQAILRRLLTDVAWPLEPCAVPEKLTTLLGSAFTEAGRSSYVLMSLLSGRILEHGGDIHNRLPPGSLLKIPYAAALSQANPDELATELAASDTEKLLLRRQQFQADRYQLFLSPIKNHQLHPKDSSQESYWHQYLGERGTGGDFPLQANLPQLALSLRAALLAQPDYFKGLTRNGSLKNSTLFGRNEADKRLLNELQAMAKTGTVSTGNGQPLVGHLAVAWPADHPVFLAVFRQPGVNGAGVLSTATPLLKRWQQKHPPQFASVRVRLLTPTDPSSWQAEADCPELATIQSRFTVCGQFRIVSSARGSRSERLVSGILHQAPNKGPSILETDVESYTDAVLDAEAQTLAGGAREAMRAVIAWNASHGHHRHADSASLCDTTHCMVFLGDLPNVARHSNNHIDTELLQLLDKLAAESGLNWLPFANGGDQRWQRQVSSKELQDIFAENQILDIRRERRKNGDLFIRLFYPASEETISCEVFRNTLKLPSCPDGIQAGTDETWQFQGIGAGHGMGLSIVRAQALADNGRNAEQILRDAYGQNR